MLKEEIEKSLPKTLWIYDSLASVVDANYQELSALWKCDSIVESPSNISEFNLSLINLSLDDKVVKRQEGYFFPQNPKNFIFRYVIGGLEVSETEWLTYISDRIRPKPSYSDYCEYDMIYKCSTEEITFHPARLIGKLKKKNSWSKVSKNNGFRTNTIED